MKKTGRNDPCPCGSGKKYKTCCLARDKSPANYLWQKMRRTEGTLIDELMNYADRYYGPEFMLLGWDEYVFGEIELEPETNDDFNYIFIPWLVFNWIPDPEFLPERLDYPQIPIALHYLQARENHISPFKKRFIEEICSQPFSFFMITNIDLGKSLTLKDLLLDRQVTVLERQATTMAKKGAIIYSRIITLDNTSIMVGTGPVTIPVNFQYELIAFSEELFRTDSKFNKQALLDYDLETRSLYFEIRDELSNPVLPQIRNTDDDPLQPTTLTFSLECEPLDAVPILADLSLREVDDLLFDAEYDDDEQFKSIEFDWLKLGNEKHAEWENTVMGHIKIDKSQLTVNVNSQNRADKIRHLLEAKLDGKIRYQHSVIESIEKSMQNRLDNPDDAAYEESRRKSDELQALPEVQAQLKEMAEKHWQAWLDEPIPALKNQTPRQAAQSATGRKYLDALLLEYELRDSPDLFQPDVQSLRQQLGLPDATNPHR